MMVERSMKPMPEALRELMVSRGFTEGFEFSERAGVSAPTISLYLSGKRGLRMNSQALPTVERIAAALGVEPEYFLEYRQAKAERLVREAMAAGKIDLDDIELIIARHDLREKLGGRSS